MSYKQSASNSEKKEITVVWKEDIYAFAVNTIHVMNTSVSTSENMNVFITRDGARTRAVNSQTDLRRWSIKNNLLYIRRSI